MIKEHQGGHSLIEQHQRNAIMRGLERSSNEDLIIISDVDEIPDLRKLNLYNKKIIANDKFTPLYNFWKQIKNDKLILYNSPKLTTQLLYELLRSFVDIIIQYPNTIICWQKYRDKNSFKIIKLNNKIFVFIKQTNNCHNYLTKIIFYLIKYEKCNNFTIKLIDSFISSNRLIIEK